MESCVLDLTSLVCSDAAVGQATLASSGTALNNRLAGRGASISTNSAGVRVPVCARGGVVSSEYCPAWGLHNVCRDPLPKEHEKLSPERSRSNTNGLQGPRCCFLTLEKHPWKYYVTRCQKILGWQNSPSAFLACSRHVNIMQDYTSIQTSEDP